MSSHNEKTHQPPLDLSGWRWLPSALMIVGGFLTVTGAALSYTRNNFQEFGYSWLMAFMFYYSIALGALFLVMIHHLTDAGWSVGIRRFCEHISSLLFPWLAVLFLPVALLVFSRPMGIDCCAWLAWPGVAHLLWLVESA